MRYIFIGLRYKNISWIQKYLYNSLIANITKLWYKSISWLLKYLQDTLFHNFTICRYKSILCVAISACPVLFSAETRWNLPCNLCTCSAHICTPIQQGILQSTAQLSYVFFGSFPLPHPLLLPGLAHAKSCHTKLTFHWVYIVQRGVWAMWHVHVAGRHMLPFPFLINYVQLVQRRSCGITNSSSSRIPEPACGLCFTNFNYLFSRHRRPKSHRNNGVRDTLCCCCCSSERSRWRISRNQRQRTADNGQGTNKATTDTVDTSKAINKTKGDCRNKSNACDSNKARARAQVMPRELCTYYTHTHTTRTPHSHTLTPQSEIDTRILKI